MLSRPWTHHSAMTIRIQHRAHLMGPDARPCLYMTVRRAGIPHVDALCFVLCGGVARILCPQPHPQGTSTLRGSKDVRISRRRASSGPSQSAHTVSRQAGHADPSEPRARPNMTRGGDSAAEKKTDPGDWRPQLLALQLCNPLMTPTSEANSVFALSDPTHRC